MRMMRYMTCLVVVAVGLWSIGCGGGSASVPGEMEYDSPEMQQKMESGEMMDPNRAPMGQQRFKPGGLPEGVVAGDERASGGDAPQQ